MTFDLLRAGIIAMTGRTPQTEDNPLQYVQLRCRWWIDIGSCADWCDIVLQREGDNNNRVYIGKNIDYERVITSWL